MSRKDEGVKNCSSRKISHKPRSRAMLILLYDYYLLQKVHSDEYEFPSGT